MKFMQRDYTEEALDKLIDYIKVYDGISYEELCQLLEAGMFDVKDENGEFLYRPSKALLAMRSMQEQSRRNGNSEMTLDEINAEIKAARAAIKEKRRKLKNSTVDSIIISVPCSIFSKEQLERIAEDCKIYDYNQCNAREFTVEDGKVNFVFPYSEDYSVTRRYMEFVDCFCKGIKNSIPENTAVKAMSELQEAMDGEAEKTGLLTEDDVNSLMEEIRNGLDNGDENEQ